MVQARYQYAIDVMLTRLRMIDADLTEKNERPLIRNLCSRIKTAESIVKKLERKEREVTFETAVNTLNDIAGVRVVCYFADDIYQIADAVRRQKDFTIVKEKNYTRKPKKSGYQSLHLILEIAIPFQKENQWIKLELQLRTAAMDYWANLDHQLRYKRGQKQAAVINEELQQCASVITQLDQKMLDIRKKIDKI